MCKFAHKILNKDDNYFFKSELTHKRQNKTFHENKIGTMPDKFGLKTNEQCTFIYKAFKWYNMLPRELTLIIKGTLFKKWIKKFYANKTLKLIKICKDYNKIINVNDFNIDHNVIKQCEDEYG